MSPAKLYYDPQCPFSQRVLNFMAAHQIQISLKNIAACAENRRELVEVCGSEQIPSLAVSGNVIHESDPIIEYLSKEYNI